VAGVSEFPKPTRRPVLTVASSVRREVQRFLSPGRVPLGAVTILGGFPGLGKSSWGILLAAELSGRDETTVIATAEDSISATVRPRLEAVDANLDRIHFITVQADDGLEDGVEIPRDLLLLEDAMHEKGAKLLMSIPWSHTWATGSTRTGTRASGARWHRSTGWRKPATPLSSRCCI
jgi:predicted ATP-dependent serine protease